MQMLPSLILPLHMAAAIAWIGFAVIVAMSAGAGGEKAFRPQMAAAVIAFLSGGYLWHLYYGTRFGPAQKVLAFGVLAAIVAAGVQGALVGRARRQLRTGTITDEVARPRIARAHQIAAGLLIVTMICMVMARQLPTG